jgi:hypothetical protein
VAQVASQLTTIANLMQQQQARPNAEFISQRDSFLVQLDNYIEETRRWVPYFVTSAILERGFLEDEGIQMEAKRAVAGLKAEAEATIQSIKAESERTIANARELADQIEARARLTAARISIADAQKQFNEAAKDLGKRTTLWGYMSVLAMTVLIGAPFLMMWWSLPDANVWPLAVYHALLRIMMLSGVTAFAIFAIRMLRAHLHLAERNRHRVRVANSVESFVNSALEPQQRDLILAKLVEAIVDFGDSGLIRHERDEVSSPTMTADALGRILSAISGRK